MARSLQLETTVGQLTPTRISGASLLLDGGAAMSTCVVSHIELQQPSIICSDTKFLSLPSEKAEKVFCVCL